MEAPQKKETTTNTIKKARKERMYFLCNQEKGFMVENGSNPPMLSWNGIPIIFKTRKEAKYAVDFFVKKLKMADSLTVVGSL